MALDGGFLHLLVNEISEKAIECRVDKIYQPSKEELLLLLHSRSFTGRLLLSARNSAPRIHFTDIAYENPAQPPMFCMLLRKYLTGARLVSVTQPGLERLVELEFNAKNALGDLINLKLVVELIGRQANIIFVGDDGRIIDSVRRTDIEKCSRMIQPGARYCYPESQNKLNILEVSTDNIIEAIINQNNTELSGAILNVLDGASPIICREIAYFTAKGNEITTDEMNSEYKIRLSVQLKKLAESLNSNGTPTLIFRPDGNPFEFTYMPISQYGMAVITNEVKSYSELLETFYGERERTNKIRKSSQDLLKLLTNLSQRISRKINAQKADLEKGEDREKLRVYGELIKANIYNIPKGASFIELQNYYDPDLKTIRIPLNVALTPAQNAQKYFKDYKKSYTAEQTLNVIIEESKKELEYIESVFDSLSRAESEVELAEIRDELVSSGYLKNSKIQRKRQKTLPFKEYESPDGYKVLVGRNNRQNDELTLRVANKDDIWLHTKNIPGSHVIICSEGDFPPDCTIKYAAELAVLNSKAKDSSNVPVDYTQVRNVKKPAGAKPGMVIYLSNKTAYVTPSKELVKNI